MTDARGPRDITRTASFWLIFAASTLGGITNSASTPFIPVYVDETLGGDAALGGIVVAVASVASMAAMPAAGAVADRRGYRVVATTGGCIAVIGMLLLALVPTLSGALTSRVLFGLGNSAAMTVVMAWLVAIAPVEQRGKALSYFGLSVWIGLALGPQLGTATDQWGGTTAVFLLCIALELATVITILILPRPPLAPLSTGEIAPPRGVLQSLGSTFRTVWTPGIVAAAAWCGEGLLIAFLIVHLTTVGMPAAGLGGAASVYTVFAISVIVARLALANLPDRVGPLRATVISLSSLTLGLIVIALTPNFWIAALGAVFVAIGFSPLYPSLTMLATRGLSARDRALGLGLFSSFTSIGYGGGALIGGIVIVTLTSGAAFLIVAALQLVALAVLVAFTRDGIPRERGEPRDSA